MLATTCSRSSGVFVRPGPPGKSVSPETSVPPVKRQSAPGVWPGVCSMRMRDRSDAQFVVVGEQRVGLARQPAGVALVHRDREVGEALEVGVSRDVVRVRVRHDDALQLEAVRLAQQPLDVRRSVHDVRLLRGRVGDDVAVVVVRPHAGDLEHEMRAIVDERHA